MNIQGVLHTAADWFAAHGLAVGVAVIVCLALLKGVSMLKRSLLKRFFPDKADAEGQKVVQSVGNAAQWLVSLVVVGVAVSFILNESGVQMRGLIDRAAAWALGNGLSIAIIVAFTFVALRVAGFLSLRLAAISQRGKLDIESQKRVDTLSSVMRWVLRAGILAVSVVMILGQVGVQIGPIIAAAGVLGLAVGFGAQNLVQDVISGFFMLLEDQVRVGDVVQLGDKSGLVEKITLRMVILRDLSGNVHYVRNGKIDVVTNMTKEFSYYVFDIGVAYGEDVDEVTRVMNEVGADLQKDPAFKDDVLEKIEVFGLDRFADSAVVVKARIKTKPIQQWRVAREFNRRLKKRFDELGIEIPFPHVTLYAGKSKRGETPAFRVEANKFEDGRS